MLLISNIKILIINELYIINILIYKKWRSEQKKTARG